MSEKVLVIGATGNVGSSLVQELVDRGVAVRAATRRPEEYEKPAEEVEVVEFDYDRPETYEAAVAGVDRAFLITKTADPVPDQTLIPLIDQAQEAGVEHVVLMTAAGIEQAGDEVPLRRVEKHLSSSGLDYTILRPTWFMQNFNPGFLLPSIRQEGKITLAAGEGKTSFVDTRDIGAVAATALTEPGHAGQEYTLTGGEALSYGEATGIISEVTGREVAYEAVSSDAMKQGLAEAGWRPDQAEMMASLFYPVEQGWAAAVSPAVEAITGREPRTFRAFAEENAGAWKE